MRIRILRGVAVLVGLVAETAAVFGVSVQSVDEPQDALLRAGGDTGTAADTGLHIDLRVLRKWQTRAAVFCVPDFRDDPLLLDFLNLLLPEPQDDQEPG